MSQNKLLRFISQSDLDKVNPRIANHAFFTGKGTFISEKNDKIISILFNNLTDEKDLVFRIQLLEFLTQSTDKKETIGSREGLVVKNLDNVLNLTNLKNFNIISGFTEYNNIVLMAYDDKVRNLLKNLTFKDLGKLSKWHLWDLKVDELVNIIEFILYYDSKKSKHFNVVAGIDEFLVKFSQSFIRNKISLAPVKEKSEEGSDNLSNDLIFIEDLLMLVDGDEKFYSDDSLIIGRFLSSSKNVSKFLNNLGFIENTDSSIWGLRYSLTALGFDLLIETIHEMQDRYEYISVNQLVKFANLYKENKIQPSIGLFLSE